MHPALERQLAGLGLDPDVPPDPAAWSRLLDVVDNAYARTGADRLEEVLGSLSEQTARVELLQAVTVAANEATEVEKALLAALELVCGHTGWPVGHAWLLDGPGGAPRASGLWQLAESGRYVPFQVATARLRHADDGFLGRVLAERRPIWMDDVRADPGFARAAAAARTGLVSALAFPVLAGEQVVAVLEFLSAAAVQPDPALLDVMAHIGTQLGRAVERARAADALRDSSRRTREIIRTASDAFISIDDAGAIVDWNPTAETTFGWDADEVLGRRLADTIVPPQRAAELDEITGAGAGDIPVNGRRAELTALHRDGREFPIELTVWSVHDAGGGRHRSAFVRDITERKRTEAELRRQALVFANLRDAILLTDAEGVTVDCNPAAEAIFGHPREQLLGTVLAEPAGSATARARFAEIRRALADGGRWKGEISFVRADTSSGVCETIVVPLTGEDGELIGTIGVNLDVTEQRRMELELRHAQKLEAVGRLAAGVAHEINTPIQFIGDNVRFLAESIETMLTLIKSYRHILDVNRAPLSWNERKQLLDEAEANAEVDYLQEEMPGAIRQSLDGVERVATIVKAMKSFAHPSGEAQAAADLNQALLDTMTVARNEIKYVADVETDLAELPPVKCHLGDLNQVFLNLLVNAAHAVDDTGRRGTIRVSTRVDGDAVVVEIADTGAGIPEDIRDRVFDPFFTTKPVGQGTGQGLALARSVVVDKHHGSIGLTSELGRGTTFTIRLPVGGVPSVSAA